MIAKPVLLIRIVQFVVFAAVAGAQSQPVDCAGTSNPEASANAKARSGSADRQTAPGLAPQIQPRRPLMPRSIATCRCGTVEAVALTAKSNSLEVPVVTAVPGSFRFDHVLLQESVQFTSATPGTFSVAMGTPGKGKDVTSPFTLGNAMAPYSFWHERPGPPQLTGAYDLVLLFQASFPLGDGATSNLKGGRLTWEVCGFSVPVA